MAKKSMSKINSGTKTFILIMAAVIAAAVVLISMTKTKPSTETVGAALKGVSYAKVGGEKRPVADASQFFGQVRAAYEAAKKHPDVLDKLYCWCKCSNEPFNHKSLLSCFVDDHGAT
jgi:pyruvate/oxaloacetate carboxyltransferase